jgi:TonB-dependent SusC/RagA subfamily outer membrane receptor
MGGRINSRVVLLSVVAMVATLLSPLSVRAQEGSLRGVVEADRSLRPLSGALVEVVGTTRSMLTDANGRFQFVGLAGTEVTLRVSTLGYRSVERVVRVGDMNVRISLAESAIELDQIVVTGTAGGTQRRAIGNVVTQVRAAETVDLAAVTNVQSLLNARAPSVIITPGTGMVGSGSQIRIRGSNSFSLTNAPLLVVDGVRADNAQSTGPSVQAFSSSVISRINDFNPEDIESIEIIKGPAAATLYGTEASNGVIHIITKRGREGRGAWNLTVRQGANWFMNAESRVPTNYWRNPTTNQIESLNLVTSEKARGTPLFRTGPAAELLPQPERRHGGGALLRGGRLGHGGRRAVGQPPAPGQRAGEPQRDPAPEDRPGGKHGLYRRHDVPELRGGVRRRDVGGLLLDAAAEPGHHHA